MPSIQSWNIYRLQWEIVAASMKKAPTLTFKHLLNQWMWFYQQSHRVVSTRRFQEDIWMWTFCSQLRPGCFETSPFETEEGWLFENSTTKYCKLCFFRWLANDFLSTILPFCFNLFTFSFRTFQRVSWTNNLCSNPVNLVTPCIFALNYPLILLDSNTLIQRKN